MSQVFVRNIGMGWHVRHKTVGWPKHRAVKGLDRVVKWHGDSLTTLIAFLAAEVRDILPAVEVAA